jgi:hypothetical protein
MDLTQPYDQEAALGLCSRLLPEDFQAGTEQLTTHIEFERIQQITKLGRSDEFDLTVYEIRHESENDPRVTLSRDSFRLLAQFGQRRALVFFTSKKSRNFRLSLVTIDLKEGQRGRTIREYSNPRRYSFYLGPDAKVGTPTRLLKDRSPDFQGLQKCFSIEVVNQEFYAQIAQLFTELTGGQREERARQPGNLHLPSQAADSPKRNEFAVRLIVSFRQARMNRPSAA